MPTKDLVRGRAQSLNKTITEVMKFLADGSQRPGGPAAGLRNFLHEKLADLGEYWYKRGVKRGHIESQKAFEGKRRVPSKLHYNGRREFFKGRKREVQVTSKIKTRTRAAASGQ